jgi:hypothetical protein
MATYIVEDSSAFISEIASEIHGKAVTFVVSGHDDIW